MDRLNNVERNYIAAATVDIPGFSPRLSSGSLFEKRDYDGNCGPSSNVCTTSSLSITCCPKDYDCFIDDGYWRCELNPLGLTRGQKIGIGIGVTVAFFLLLAAALVIFCCCCRKAAKIASAAVNNSNNNQHGMVPPPVIYGNTAAPYDPVGAQLAHQQPGPPPTQEPKLYGEGGGYYHPQQAYDPYVQQQQQQHPTMPYQPTQTPAPPYQPSSAGTYPQNPY